MKKKKGFVFVETLVVTAVLTISLLAAYSTFSALIIKEKSRITYNDSVYLYRTYYLGKFLKNFNLYIKEQNVNEINSMTGMRQGYTQVGCDSIFSNESKVNKGLCEGIINKLNIQAIYLTYKDLGYLQDCKNWEGKCALFSMLSEEEAEYFKTIGGSSKTIEEAYEKNEGYRLIVKYVQKKDGTVCGSDEDECQTFFATVNIGDIDGK